MNPGPVNTAGTVGTRIGHAAQTDRSEAADRALLDAVDAIAEMARRVQRNGPESTYASEKLAWALYRAAEALALCGAEWHEVAAEARHGYQHGRWLTGDPS